MVVYKYTIIFKGNFGKVYFVDGVIVKVKYIVFNIINPITNFYLCKKLLGF